MPQPGVPPTQEQMNATLSLLENPMISQMMEQAMQQNPDMFRQMMVGSNPMLQSMFQNNPEAADNLIRTMMNPAMLRNMMQMQQAFGGAAAPQQQQQQQQQPGGSMNASATGGLDFGAMLQQMNNASMSSSGGGAPAFPPMFGMPPTQQQQQAPADRYRNQLQQLYGMGFDDEQRCLAALESSYGNLNRAVDMLLSGDVPIPAPAPSTNTEGNSSETNNQGDTAPKDEGEKKD